MRFGNIFSLRVCFLKCFESRSVSLAFLFCVFIFVFRFLIILFYREELFVEIF